MGLSEPLEGPQAPADQSRPAEASQGQPAPSRVVVLVLGPPGSGKSTLALTLAQEWGLALYDRDEPQWRDDDRAFLRAIRNDCQRDKARAVVVRSGTTPLARRRIISLTRATRIIIMNTAPEECLRRIGARGRGDIQWQIEGIRKWFTTPPTDDERQTWEAR